MAAALYGILGQSAPGATTLTATYTVPAGRHATVKVAACNRGGSPATIRVAFSPNGASIADAHYNVYDLSLPSHESKSTDSMMIGAGDVVRVYSSTGDVSFTVSGLEADN